MFLQCGKYTSLWERVFRFLEDNAFSFDGSAVLLFNEVDDRNYEHVHLSCIVREGEYYFALLLILDTSIDEIVDLIVDVSTCVFKLELVPFSARESAYMALARCN